MKTKYNYTISWYWWVLMFILGPIGWIFAAIVYDDMTNQDVAEWNKQMERELTKLKPIKEDTFKGELFAKRFPAYIEECITLASSKENAEAYERIKRFVDGYYIK